MKNSNLLKRDFKILLIVNFSTAIFMLLLSMVGHFITPYKLIPTAVIGGTTGLVLGIYLCFKRHYIDRNNLIPVLLSSLIYFGAMAFIAVFNLHSPLIIISCFSLTGISTILGNHYFSNHLNLSRSKIYGTLGLVLAFPALFFILASFLKSQFDSNFLFGAVDYFLNRTNGQENFNAITPFIFGGGLSLAFGINVFAQLENFTTPNIFKHKNLKISFKALNLFVVILTGILGLTVLSYLAFENL